MSSLAPDTQYTRPSLYIQSIALVGDARDERRDYDLDAVPGRILSENLCDTLIHGFPPRNMCQFRGDENTVFQVRVPLYPRGEKTSMRASLLREEDTFHF